MDLVTISLIFPIIIHYLTDLHDISSSKFSVESVGAPNVLGRGALGWVVVGLGWVGVVDRFWHFLAGELFVSLVWLCPPLSAAISCIYSERGDFAHEFSGFGWVRRWVWAGLGRVNYRIARGCGRGCVRSSSPYFPLLYRNWP